MVILPQTWSPDEQHARDCLWPHCPPPITAITSNSLAVDKMGWLWILTVKIEAVDTRQEAKVEEVQDGNTLEFLAALGSLFLRAFVLNVLAGGAFLDVGGNSSDHGREGDKGDDIFELHFEG